jgi:hypothetical protein
LLPKTLNLKDDFKIRMGNSKKSGGLLRGINSSAIFLAVLLVLVLTTISTAAVAVDCYNCSNCSSALSIAYNGTTITLARDINSTGTCIDFNRSHVNLNCQGYSIIGYQDGFGINMSGIENVSVVNCTVRNYSRALSLNDVNSSSFSDLNITWNNGDYAGFYSFDSYYNNISRVDFTFNNASDNGGIYLEWSSGFRVINTTYVNNNVTKNDIIVGGGIVGLMNNSNSSYFEDIVASGNNVNMTHGVNNLVGGGIVGLRLYCGYNVFNQTRISNNVIDSNSYLSGGGCMGLVSSCSNNTIIGLNVSGNTVSSVEDLYGSGGVGLSASCSNNVLENVNISNNLIYAGAWLHGGGSIGLYSESSGNMLSEVIIRRNDISAQEYIIGGGIFGFDEKCSYNNITTINLSNNTVSTIEEDIYGGGGFGFYDNSENNSVQDLRIINNSIDSHQIIYGGGGIGLVSSNLNNITDSVTENNTVSANIIHGGGGIGLHISDTNNLVNAIVRNNKISITSTLEGGSVIGVLYTSSYNRLSGLTVSQNSVISTQRYGILGIEYSDNNSISSSQINDSSECIISIIGSSTNQNNNLSNLRLANAGKNAINVVNSDSVNTRFTNITITNSTLAAINITKAQDTYLEDIDIYDSAEHLFISSASVALNDTLLSQYEMSNASFSYGNSYAYVDFINESLYASGSNLSLVFSVSSNSVFVNTSADSGFNQSANITLYGISYTNPVMQVDWGDTGSFEDCPSSVCENLSYAGEVYKFNVTHFTAYKVAENLSGCGDIEAAGTVVDLQGDVSAAVTCFNVRADDVVIDCHGFTVTGKQTDDGQASKLPVSAQSTCITGFV